MMPYCVQIKTSLIRNCRRTSEFAISFLFFIFAYGACLNDVVCVIMQAK